jgi:hypothetical protein
MGRRNTGPKSNLQVFQRLNSFESADSRKTLPCLGLIEYSQKDQVSLKTQSDQQIRRVLHRPVEPAGFTNTYSTCRCKVSESPKRGGVLNDPSAGERSVLPTFNQELTALRPRPFRITARAKPNAPTNSRVLVLASGTAAAGVTVKIPRPASLLSVRTAY